MTTKRTAATATAVLAAAALWLSGAPKNDRSAPSVYILAPLTGSTVDGGVNILLSTMDNVTAVRVAVEVDGQPVCNLLNSGSAKAKNWTCFWESALETEKQRTIHGTAYDAAGNHQSTSLQVTSAAILLLSGSVPDAICGEPWVANFRLTGGMPPYTWSVIAGALPSWATFTANGATAQAAGTAPIAGPDGTCDGQMLLARLRASLGIT
jgi:hypothetical protein